MDEPDVQLPRSRMALLFMVMLVTAAGNTAMQSVMPSIGTHLRIADVWVESGLQLVRAALDAFGPVLGEAI